MTYRQKFAFSTMLPLDAPFSYQGIEFSYVQTFYEAMKVAKGNVALRRRIAAMDPYEAQREGRRLEQAGLIRPGFQGERLAIMEFALRKQYAKGTEWRRRLMETGSSLITNDNWYHDQFFGDCLCGEREYCQSPGDNNLGKMLMALRAEFRANCEHDFQSFDPSGTMLRCTGCFEYLPNPADLLLIKAERESAILNLTGEVTTAEQFAAGIHIPREEDMAVIRAMTHVEGAPSLEELSERADVLARLTQELGFRRALVGGNIGMAVVLSDALRLYGIIPMRWERDGQLHVVPNFSEVMA